MLANGDLKRYNNKIMLIGVKTKGEHIL